MSHLADHFQYLRTNEGTQVIDVSASHLSAHPDSFVVVAIRIAEAPQEHAHVKMGVYSK